MARQGNGGGPFQLSRMPLMLMFPRAALICADLLRDGQRVRPGLAQLNTFYCKKLGRDREVWLFSLIRKLRGPLSPLFFGDLSPPILVSENCRKARLSAEEHIFL